MAAYVIADVEVIDSAKFREYGNQVPATVEEYGGKYLVRGGAVEKAEGNWEPNRMVVKRIQEGLYRKLIREVVAIQDRCDLNISSKGKKPWFYNRWHIRYILHVKNN